MSSHRYQLLWSYNMLMPRTIHKFYFKDSRRFEVQQVNGKDINDIIINFKGINKYVYVRAAKFPSAQVCIAFHPLHSYIPFPLPKLHAEFEAQEPFPYPFRASLKIYTYNSCLPSSSPPSSSSSKSYLSRPQSNGSPPGTQSPNRQK